MVRSERLHWDPLPAVAQATADGEPWLLAWTLHSTTSYRLLARESGVSDQHIVTLPRLAFSHYVAALRAGVERARVNGLQPIVVAAGGKPAAIAAALQSVVESEAPVLTTVPDRVVSLKQVPAGELRLFQLYDPTNVYDDGSRC